MHVHRSVGQVSFVTCDMVLGAEGTTAKVEQTLREGKPETLALDVPAEDLPSIPKGEFNDPFLGALALAVQPVASESVYLPYQRILVWARENHVEVRAIAPRSRIGMMNGRRMARVVEKAEGPTAEARARNAVEALLKDPRVALLIERRRVDLSESLQTLLRTEPPRTMVCFSFPWGEMVSSDVRRKLGLHRVEGGKLTGGWPE